MDWPTFTSHINEFQQLHILWGASFPCVFYASFLHPVLTRCSFWMSSEAKMILTTGSKFVSLICYSCYMRTLDIHGKSRILFSFSSIYLKWSINIICSEWKKNGSALHYTIIGHIKWIQRYLTEQCVYRTMCLQSNVSTQQCVYTVPYETGVILWLIESSYFVSAYTAPTVDNSIHTKLTFYIYRMFQCSI